MKPIAIFLSVLLIASCASGSGKEKSYTGSTPAGPVVKAFLGIPPSDSVDFIRWELFIRDNNYHIHCNYGIGKAGTNGFISGGVKMELSGECKKKDNFYQLQNGTKSLWVAELNEDLLHLSDTDHSLLLGNGGFSYTLNNLAPVGSDQFNFRSQPMALKDSMVFDGRSPCKVPGIVTDGKECYKLKWRVVLYADPLKNEPATYKVLGTKWRQEGGIKGAWTIISNKNGHIIYQLNDDKGNGFLYFLKADNNILLFTDAGGKLLTGDLDFSYTLNRKS
jgi:hypothetical protein